MFLFSISKFYNVFKIQLANSIMPDLIWRDLKNLNAFLIDSHIQDIDFADWHDFQRQSHQPGGQAEHSFQAATRPSCGASRGLTHRTRAEPCAWPAPAAQ